MKKYLITILLCIPFLLPHLAHADITSNLLLYYKFDEGVTGATIIDSAGSNNGTEVNLPTYVTGKIGPYAINLVPASSQYVVTNNTITGTGAFTISAWVNVTAGGVYTRIAETSYASGFFLGMNSTGLKFNFIVNGGNSDFNGCTSAAYSTGTWYLVTGVYDGVNEVMYVNGVQACSFSEPSSPSGDLNLYVGRQFNGAGSFFSGPIDDVRYYTRALSAADVAQLYAYTGNASVKYQRFMARLKRFLVKKGKRVILN